MSAPDVELKVVLPEATAFALAELCKRFGWSDATSLSANRDEAFEMIEATNAVRRALIEAGVVVR
ncbi:hypothetical protein [Hydrogenophaga sp.]|uniref:DUF7706 family protein n=1 Tax=Hydrogenophaga sp. TaxID=1904254 RepID=UPI002731EECD|nr:hypothetical protein [Hydrogenophaga sp.]MDP1688034.1 hypothetical protein [Hydrogenophaga sp.]